MAKCPDFAGGPTLALAKQLLSGPHFYLGTGKKATPLIGSGCYDKRQRQRQPQAREGSPGERARGNEGSPGFVVETTEYAPFSLESVSPAALWWQW